MWGGGGGGRKRKDNCEKKRKWSTQDSNKTKSWEHCFVFKKKAIKNKFNSVTFTFVFKKKVIKINSILLPFPFFVVPGSSFTLNLKRNGSIHHHQKFFSSFSFQFCFHPKKSAWLPLLNSSTVLPCKANVIFKRNYTLLYKLKELSFSNRLLDLQVKWEC